jgi:hypothetical protein
MTEGINRKEVWATCGHCSHTFVIYAPLPAPVEVVCRAMKNARCPNCRRKKQKLYVATEADIVAALSPNAVSPPDGGAGEFTPQSPSSPAPISSHQENS